MRLSYTAIDELPAGLKVPGTLYLSECRSLASVPDDLEVGGGVHLSGTRVGFLADHVEVGGGVYREAGRSPER